MPSLQQTQQGSLYRIVRDPNNSKLWAYELENGRFGYLPPVGGFQNQERAKRAAKLAMASMSR